MKREESGASLCVTTRERECMMCACPCARACVYYFHGEPSHDLDVVQYVWSSTRPEYVCAHMRHALCLCVLCVVCVALAEFFFGYTVIVVQNLHTVTPGRHTFKIKRIHTHIKPFTVGDAERRTPPRGSALNAPHASKSLGLHQEAECQRCRAAPSGSRPATNIRGTPGYISNRCDQTCGVQGS